VTVKFVLPDSEMRKGIYFNGIDCRQLIVAGPVFA